MMNNIELEKHGISQTILNWQDERHSQTLFSISNGEIGIRSSILEKGHYSSPGIFVADLYDNSIGVSSELVNINNEAEVEFIVDNEKIDLKSTIKKKSYKRHLDYLTNTMTINFTIDHTNLQCNVKIRKILHITEKDLIMTRISINDVNGTFNQLNCNVVRSKSASNGYMGGVYPELQIHHVNATKYYKTDTVSELELRTLNRKKVRWSMISVCNLPRICIDLDSRWGYSFALPKNKRNFDLKLMERISVIREEDTPYINESNVSNIKEKFQYLWEKHENSWSSYRDRFKINVKGNDTLNKYLQYNVHQLIQNVNPEKEIQNFPSRGLTSEYHSGHFFFNTEFYKLIYFTNTFPEIAKSFLEFRYQTLCEAKELAIAFEKKGAFFAEEVDTNGKLSSAYEILDLKQGRKYYENSGHLKYFVTGAVAYAVVYYYIHTGDSEFMNNKGKELLKECSLFAKSIFEFDESKNKYVINNTMGPDEYHYHINNSYFVNFIMKETIGYALTYCSHMFPQNTLDELRKIHENVYFPKSRDGVLEQFDGYFELQDKWIEKFDKNYRPILEQEDFDKKERLESINSQIIKEADLILMFKLFPHKFECKIQKNTLDYYSKRTAHESSLSSAPYALIHSYLGNDMSKILKLLYLSMGYDIDYTPVGSFNNGIHFAGYAGAWEVIIFGLCGLSFDGYNQIKVNPHKDLFNVIQSIEFSIVYKMKKYEIFIDENESKIIRKKNI